MGGGPRVPAAERPRDHDARVEVRRLAPRHRHDHGRDRHVRRVPAALLPPRCLRDDVRLAQPGHREAPVDGHAHRSQVVPRVRDPARQRAQGPLPHRQHRDDAAARRPRHVRPLRGRVAADGARALHLRQPPGVHGLHRRRAAPHRVRRERGARHVPHRPHEHAPHLRPHPQPADEPRRHAGPRRAADVQGDRVPHRPRDGADRRPRHRHGRGAHPPPVPHRLARAQPPRDEAPHARQAAPAHPVRRRLADEDDAAQLLHLRAVGPGQRRRGGAEPLGHVRVVLHRPPRQGRPRADQGRHRGHRAHAGDRQRPGQDRGHRRRGCQHRRVLARRGPHRVRRRHGGPQLRPRVGAARIRHAQPRDRGAVAEPRLRRAAGDEALHRRALLRRRRRHRQGPRAQARRDHRHRDQQGVGRRDERL
mmetsp:Transcript_38582/g.119231  ORF Transcript_38582/g.119231 Transcript_38582/m.119231 type:complete len:420 (-) Transcript_38582:617-1876(-)